MSKEVNKVNINRELIKKEIIDCSVILVDLIIIFCIVNYSEFNSYEYGISFAVIFLLTCLAFEYVRNMTKRNIEGALKTTFDKTMTGVNTIQDKNNSQKANNVISTDKIQNVVSLVENLKKYSQEMKDVTNLTQEKTNQSLSFTNNEYEAVKTNIEKMFSIRHKIQTIAELILELSDFVQSISSTIGLVEDIAEQTNLLALNAAVEAARAGEHGKGFAVVASEIRKLADESKQATSKIITLINDIQQTANSTVLATEEGTKEIESGLELAHTISENVQTLIEVMQEISVNVGEIISSSKQINTDSKNTDNYIKEISEIVENNNKIVNENESLFASIEVASNEFKTIM